jgi:hypothetical protein
MTVEVRSFSVDNCLAKFLCSVLLRKVQINCKNLASKRVGLAMHSYNLPNTVFCVKIKVINHGKSQSHLQEFIPAIPGYF